MKFEKQYMSNNCFFPNFNNIHDFILCWTNSKSYFNK